MPIGQISYVHSTNSGIFYDRFRPPPTFRHHDFPTLLFVSSGQIVRTSFFASGSSPARVVLFVLFSCRPPPSLVIFCRTQCAVAVFAICRPLVLYFFQPFGQTACPKTIHICSTQSFHNFQRPPRKLPQRFWFSDCTIVRFVSFGSCDLHAVDCAMSF